MATCARISGSLGVLVVEPEPEASTPDEEQPANATAPAPPPPDEDASTAETDPDLDPDDDEAQAAAAAWISVPGDAIFQGTPGDGRHRRRRPGRLDGADVAAATRWFVEPPGLQDALFDLRTKGLVVLAGTESTGRRCAATWLLAQVSSGDLVVLSPGNTIDQLARKEFTQGRGYPRPCEDLTVLGSKIDEVGRRVVGDLRSSHQRQLPVELDQLGPCLQRHAGHRTAHDRQA